MIGRFLGALFLVLLAGSAWAQNTPVYESGSVTPGHAACFATTGVVQDCNGSGGPYLNILGILGTGLTLYMNDGPTSGPYHQLALGADVLSGGAMISYNAYGGASPLPLTWNINGVTTIFNVSPGTVSSVGLSAPSFFTVTGSPVIASGTLGLSLNSQGSSNVLAAPTGSPGIPAFRQLSASDLTGLAASATTDTTVATNISSGTLPAARLPLFTSTANGAVVASGGGTSNFLRADGSWQPISGSAGGTVTSFSASVPTGFTESVANPTSTPALTIGLSNETANTVWAGPSSGSATAPGFRSLVGADLPVPSASSLGGVESGAASSSQVMLGISTGGAPQFGAVPVGALPAGCAVTQGLATTQTNGTTTPVAAVVATCSPSRSGNVLVAWSGSLFNNTANSDAHTEIYYSTASVSAGGNCSAVGGSALAQTQQDNTVETDSKTPDGGGQLITGLSTSATYYIQLCYWETGGGNAKLAFSSISVMEQ